MTFDQLLKILNVLNGGATLDQLFLTLGWENKDELVKVSIRVERKK